MKPLKLLGTYSLVAAGLFLAGTTQAAVWTDVGPDSGFMIGTDTIVYSPSPAFEVKYYDDNLTPQSPEAIEADLEALFGISLNPAVSACDNPTSDCTAGTTGSTGTGVYSNAYTSAADYDILAIHFGKGELVFRWAAPVLAGSTFEIGGLPKGLSNYRAFLSNPIVPVPEPETYAMLLMGLGLVGFAVHSRKRA